MVLTTSLLLVDVVVCCREVVVSSASGVEGMCTCPTGGSCTAFVMFVCGVSVVLLLVVFIIFSVLEEDDGRDAMSYFSAG